MKTLRSSMDFCGQSTDAVISLLGFTFSSSFVFSYFLIQNHVLVSLLKCLILHTIITVTFLYFVIIYFAKVKSDYWANQRCSLLPNILRAYVLGFCFGLGLLLYLISGCSPDYISLWPFGLYLCLLGFFHWSEFYFTAICNPTELAVDLYMLPHSPEHTVAVIASFLEYWIEDLLLSHLFPYNYCLFFLRLLGLLLCISGELLRKTALVTASTNFNHYVQMRKRDNHVLITHGVYAWFRHPAYVGWFYWSIGTQLLLMNPVCLVAYVIVTHCFFKDRVNYEERTLLYFFGDAYRQYQKSVGTGLPFIHGYDLSEI